MDGSARAKELLRLPGAEDVSLSASPQLAAISFFGPRDSYVLAGPPAGPFRKVPALPGSSPPYYATVNHDVLFTLEEPPGTIDEARHAVFEPGAPPRELGLPGDVYGVAYDGDLLAYNTGDDRVVVRNWRTGAERAIILPESPDWLDVRADGAVVATADSNVYEVAPDGPPILLSGNGKRAQFAGERIVYLGGSGRAGGIRQLFAVDADGRGRKIGVPSATLGTFTADPQRVLWTANGCLLAADLSAPVATAPAAGPCARSEVSVIGYNAPIRRDRTVPVRLRCVAAPRACRGTLHLALVNKGGGSSSVRFSIPCGGRATLSPRLSSAAYAAARRDHDELGVWLVVSAVTVDPGGRRTEFTGGVSGRVR